MLIVLALGCLTGTTFLNTFSTLAHPLPIVMSFTSLLVISLFALFFKNQNIKKIGTFLLSASMGFSWAYFAATQKQQWEQPSVDINKPISVCGTIDGLTQYREHTLRFDALLDIYHGKKLMTKPVKVRLHWSKPPILLHHQDKFCAKVKLKPRWHLANPGMSDQEKQLFLEGISLTGKILELENYQQVHSYSLTRFRQKLNDDLANLLVDKTFLGVIQATTLGVYHNITPGQWQIFQATGTIHAIAISGLHISIIALICGGWVTFLVRRFPRFTDLMPAQCYGAIFALIGALIYSALAGFSVPTQRALVMIVVCIYALFKRHMLFTWHALAIACLGVLLVDPLATMQIGFWLSFGCVGALIYGGSHNASSWWHQWVVPQWIVFIGLIPFCVFFFQSIPWLSPFANMIVLPVIDFFIVPCCLGGLFISFISPSMAKFVFTIADFTLGFVYTILEKMVNMSLPVIEIGEIPTTYLILALIASCLLIAPKGLPSRHLAWLGYLPMLLYQGQHPKQGECFFTLLDVGQGLASIIQTEHHALLFDAGPRYHAQDNAGKRVIKPFMRQEHIKHFDKVIISHGDLDHRGGLEAFEQGKINEILSSEPLLLTQQASLCKDGSMWEWDGVTFTLLNGASESEQAAKRKHDRNNHSCVLKVSTQHHSILLTGDIEQKAEERLLKTYPHMLASTILVVPHHGSLTSSSQAFVQAVKPQYALFPVGIANQYGFPKQAVLKRYEEVGAKNLLVSQTGALLFRLENKPSLTPPLGWREKSRRYWHRTMDIGDIR
ncbi:MAG: DNA internalization-related competence protein ComEC/Rec2 [Proteobacteria bacterium]|nr:DNA internalization-related competence protein ComEC/Rec2 [Pseudomonadota bacterium]